MVCLPLSYFLNALKKTRNELIESKSHMERLKQLASAQKNVIQETKTNPEMKQILKTLH